MASVSVKRFLQRFLLWISGRCWKAEMIEMEMTKVSFRIIILFRFF